jgi:2-polyprenyl-6-methoxyphenol hydroxylase-like FAD-dependent oxidoreductase
MYYSVWRLLSTANVTSEDNLEDGRKPRPVDTLAAGKKIIIAGAGIAGLSFVVALRRQWLSQPPSLIPPTVIIYERDTKDFGAEREGFSISIRSDTNSAGLQALSKLNLLETALAQSITGVQEDSGSFRLWDKNWGNILRVKLKSPASLPVPGMRIARNVLRRILIEAVPASDEIHWGTTCISAVQLGSGRVGVQLDNGETDECDLLIAADGSKSKIRASFRPEDKLNFAGAVIIGAVSRFKDKALPPPVDRDWGIYLPGTGHGLFVSPVDERSALWSLSYLAPEPRKIMKQPISPEQASLLLKEASHRGKGLAEPFQTLVNATDISTLMMLNTMDKQPFPHLTGSLEGMPVVFLGDANHAVSPFAGAGANLALMDGWDLAEQLCKCDTLSKALASYDALNLPRAKNVARFSHWAIIFAHFTGWKLMLFTWAAKIINRLFFR